MITLRKLQLKDVPLMLEWMHDEEAKHIFQNNFAEIDDVAAKKFVENSFREDQQHFAIVAPFLISYQIFLSLFRILFDDKHRKQLTILM